VKLKSISYFNYNEVKCIFDNLRKVLVTSRTGQPFLSDTVRRCRLSFYGHLNRADPSQDHYRALQSCGVETEDRPTMTDLAENGGDRPATNESWPGVSQTMCTGHSGMVTTRDNGYVYDNKPLKKICNLSSPLNTWHSYLHFCHVVLVTSLGANYKKILRLSYEVIITYDNRKSNLR